MEGAARRGWSTIVVVCLALVAGACGSAGTGSAAITPKPGVDEGVPVSGGTLVDYQNFAGVEPAHIDPAMAADVQSSQPGHLLFEGLTAYDYRTGVLEPAVAESWTSNADASVWTFKIRPGVQWSNGDPVLPSDFKYAWERAVKPQLASEVAYHITDDAQIIGTKEVAAGTATEASGIEADDANLTLTVHLAAPVSFFPDLVAHLVFSPVPRRIVAALPDQTKWEQGIMIGDGPYKMAAPWQHNQAIKLVRNDMYWGGVEHHPAYIDTIDFRITKDVDAAWAAFAAGQGQTGLIPPGQYADVKAAYPGRVADQPVTGLSYWAFNMKDPVVGGPQNVKLRQAISLVIDKQKMVDDVYNGARKVATGVAPPSLPGYKAGLSKFPSRDVSRAKQLLAEWEKDTGKKASALPAIKLNFPAGTGSDPNAVIIQANLAELGIKSQLAPMDSTTYVEKMHDGEGQFFRSGWIADFTSYDNMLWPLFGKASADNSTGYSNAKFDDLISEARRTTDATKQNDLYQQAESIVLNDDTVIVPLTWYQGNIAWSSQLHNLVQSSLLFVAYEDAWLSPS